MKSGEVGIRKGGFEGSKRSGSGGGKKRVLEGFVMW